jgi:hypothetical protein
MELIDILEKEYGIKPKVYDIMPPFGRYPKTFPINPYN